MTCGRTDHTKFASAQPKAVVSPLTNTPAGIYDNRATDRREWWAWDRLNKQTMLVQWVWANQLADAGLKAWGSYPDVPKGQALGAPTQTYGDTP